MKIIDQVKQAANEISQAPRVPINITIGVPTPILLAAVGGVQRGKQAAIDLVGRARVLARDFLDATGGVGA